MMLQNVKKIKFAADRNKALTAVKLKIFISIELPYWFKARFWPKILEIYRTQYAKDNFT